MSNFGRKDSVNGQKLSELKSIRTCEDHVIITNPFRILSGSTAVTAILMECRLLAVGSDSNIKLTGLLSIALTLLSLSPFLSIERLKMTVERDIQCDSDCKHVR